MENANPRNGWCDLLPEILSPIATILAATDTMDLCRLRAVCRSWRANTLPYKFPIITLPFFNDRRHSDPKYSGAYFILVERIVYRIELPDESQNPDFWLVKLEGVGHDGRVKIINPVTNNEIEISAAAEMPAELNPLDYQISEVCRGYALRYVNPSQETDPHYAYSYAKKVAVSAATGSYDVLVVDHLSRLWSINSNTKKWTQYLNSIGYYDFPGARFYDVANLWGLLLAAEASGEIWAIRYNSGHLVGIHKGNNALKRRLVDSDDGNILLVEEMGNANPPFAFPFFVITQPVVDVAVYAKSGESWLGLDIQAMSGCIIVVGDDCSYNIPARQLQGARIFYTDRYSCVNANGVYVCFECDCRGLVCTCIAGLQLVADGDDDVRAVYEGVYGHNIGVYDSETEETGTALTLPNYATIFWPPPAWLRRQ